MLGQGKTKYHNDLDHIPRYRYFNNIVGMTIGTFAKFCLSG